jgi:SAM-dependent methyltransferase
MLNDINYRGWEYAHSGDYHKNLDPNWSYTPTYLQKVKQVHKFIEALPKTAQILDVACGEGVFVEEFAAQGLNIQGIDLNYESQYVQRGDVRQLPFGKATLDAVLFLDALEHLTFVDQPRALAEIHRILRPQGKLLITIPNLAHLNSRFNLLFRGTLDRTDCAIDHLGERPMGENKQLLEEAGFTILDNVGITFTVPILYRKIICRRAAQFSWLHDALEPLSRWWPSLAMLNCFVCEKN